MSISEQRVSANGVSLWTATQGSGPPVALCHGGPGIYDYLGPVAAMIDDVATVHRYDQRGCGRSQDLGPYDITTFIDDLDALRAYWGYEAWTVVGYSWGASLALLYAIQYPERTSCLVYFSGTGVDPAWHQEYRSNREVKLPPTERKRFRLLNQRRLTATGEELKRIKEERSYLLEKSELYDVTRLNDVPRYDRFPINYSLNSALNAEENRMEETGELPSKVSRIKVPTLVLDGEGDPRPRWARAHLAQLIPNSRHVTIARAGHEPWIEQPEATTRALRDFLMDPT
ncbi:MAG: alpha/beta hydrolase [Dehalococcoidia bacterium]|nr:alpha/beta hydrolase [Dehalococcoidia bacterium]